VDDGSIRQSGSTHEVVSAYESDMRSVDPVKMKHKANAHLRASFVSWGIVEQRGSLHEITSLEPVTVAFLLNVMKPIHRGIHGISLYNVDRQLVWGWAAYDLEFTAGVHELTYHYPMLPVKPGPYSWYLTLWDDDGLVDEYEGVPELLVSADSQQHPSDEWAGLLNIPSNFSIVMKDRQ